MAAWGEASATDGERSVGAPRVAYIMSRFPKITETFVLLEMKALERLGCHVDVFPLLRQPPGPRHVEAAAYERRAHFTPFLSLDILRANWRLLRRRPRLYLSTWWHALKATWPSPNFLLGALAYYPKCVLFSERMRRLRVDHVHAHFANHPALAALVVGRLTGLPFSFTAHGSDLHVERSGLREKVADASFVVTVSEYNKDLIEEECGSVARDKIVVIHCGADPSLFLQPTLARKNGGGLRKFRAIAIACVARFEEVKGHRFLMHACKLLDDEGVEVRCDLLGDGPAESEVRRLVRDLGIEDRVRFHGAVPRTEVHRVLSESDVAVLASYPTKSGKREGIPVALMEAMMSGLPVVASALSGIPELVDDGRTGYLVPPGDPWALADRLAKLAEAPALRRSMGSAARRKACGEFDLDAGARRLLEQIECRAAASRYCDT